MNNSQEPQDSSSSKQKVGYFQDNDRKTSGLRLMSFVSLMIAIVVGFLTFFMKDLKSEGIYITFAFLTSAFAPKVTQKFDE